MFVKDGFHQRTVRAAGIIVWAWVLINPILDCVAQAPVGQRKAEGPAWQEQMRDLAGLLEATRQDLEESKRKIEALQEQVRALEQGSAAAGNAAGLPSEDAAAANKLAAAVADIEDQQKSIQEQQKMDQAEIAQHAQTKVETGSKYPVQITGMILLTSSVNDGAVDNIDLPIVALPRTSGIAHGSTTATLRQSILGLDANGPHLAGARSYADIHADFFGGLAPADYQAGNGIVRMRTAHAGLSWKDTGVAFSLDHALFSPRSPTSLMTVAVPALAWSGNLWTWIPQITAGHVFHSSDREWFKAEAGAMDVPDPGVAASPSQPQPSAAEKSRYPGSELRLAIGHGLPSADDSDYSGFDHAASVGIGGYWSPHDAMPGVHTTAWAGTLDWNLPAFSFLDFSGEFYRGKSLGGLGGGVFKDYVTNQYTMPDKTVETTMLPLDDIGGWIQGKARLNHAWQWNAAVGQDNGYASELRRLDPSTEGNYATLARNQTIVTNIIYTPSAYLLFSLEYRKIRSWPIRGAEDAAQTFGLAMGYQF